MLQERNFFKNVGMLGFLGFALGFGFLASWDWWNGTFESDSLVEGAEIADLSSGEDQISAKVAIVPRSRRAEELQREALEKISELNQAGSGQVERIIVVSSNHLKEDSSGVVTVSSQDWDEQFSDWEFDSQTAKRLQAENLVQVKNGDFQESSGIRNLLSLTGEYFSGAQVLPLLIKSDYSPGQVEELVVGLEDFTQDGKNLLILATDFSSSLDQNWARFHDQKSLEVIQNFQLEQVYSLDVDCPEGLYLALKIAQGQEAEQFNLLQNTNSGELADKALPGDDTSYITGFFTTSEGLEKSSVINSTEGPTSAHLLFGGDVMLDRNVRYLANEKGVNYLTEPVERLFWSQDINWINLEGAITSNPSVSLGAGMDNFNHFRFTFDPEQSRQFLAYNRIGAVSLANNHALNFGREGLAETREILTENQVDYLEYFAPGPENENWLGSLIQEVGEQEIATVPYNWFGGADLEAVTAEVNRLTKIADYVIVYAHWGAEYQLTPTGRQQAEAHQLVEAGADLIIGAHPHVVEPVEVYQSDSGERQGVIFYSLGNLIFDQYFSPEVKERLVVGVRLTEDRVEFNLAPLNVNAEKQLVFASEDQRVKLLERLARDSEGSEAVREGIQRGRFEFNRR